MSKQKKPRIVGWGREVQESDGQFRWRIDTWLFAFVDCDPLPQLCVVVDNEPVSLCMVHGLKEAGMLSEGFALGWYAAKQPR